MGAFCCSDGKWNADKIRYNVLICNNITNEKSLFYQLRNYNKNAYVFNFSLVTMLQRRESVKKTIKFVSSIVGIGLILFSVTTASAAPQDSLKAPSNVKKASQTVKDSIIQIKGGHPVTKSNRFVHNNASKPRGITPDDVKRGYKKGEVIVKFKPGKSLEALGAAGTAKGLRVAKNLDRALGIQLLKFESGMSESDMVKFLKESRTVEYAEPNYIYQPTSVSDPLYGKLWGLKNTGQSIEGESGKAGIDIKAETAWARTKGSSSTVIAVIDTGTDYTHPDLKDNIWKNPGEVPNDGIDNDKNGYIDDVNGWNFFDGNNNPYYGPGEDDHGTHVSGTIAGKANTAGVIGVAPNVKVMPLKFIGPFGGSLDDAIAAINYAKAKGVKITNNSWGGGGYSQALYDTIKNSNSLFVAAAGNSSSNADTTPMYPAAYNLSNILSVAAITNTGSMASFSNYGATSVDVAAPGQSILSTLPLNTYEYFDGTSMAAPHATGVAALVTAVNSSFTPLQIKDRIMKTVTKLSSLTGKTVTGGLINAGAAVVTDVDGEIPGVKLNGTSVTSTLNATSDKDDVYSITLLKGEKVSVSLTGAKGTDFDIYLYNSSAKTVNSSSGMVAFSEKAGTSTESFSFVAPSDGTYYLDVYAYKGSGSYTATVKYGVTAGVYEDTSTALNFNGNWKKVTSSAASGGAYKTVNEPGARVRLVFNGTAISFKTIKSSTRGIAKVTLDGTAYNVDLYSATTVNQAVVFNKTGLKAGRHVLTIEWTGKPHAGAKKFATVIDIDSLTVK
jgi:subtilisin family serine protease